jgi:acyl carrier protein
MQSDCNNGRESGLNLEEQVIQSLEASLNIKFDRRRFGPDSQLLGAVPEFDSMAVVALLTHLEERFGFTVEDDEVDGTTFATVGSLAQFVRGKLAA